MSSAETHTATGKMPRQIPYIIANEGCERFSFYGMRNILTPFLISTLLLMIPIDQRTGEAKHVFHTFVIGVYFFPLLGGWLADRFFGKYNTIFWLSLVYCAGHACLAIFENSVNGFYFGLFLIAFGSGGIKPLVASFVGDQFDQTNKHKAKLVFDLFYWIINFGSFFASLLMPMFLRDYGPSIAFGIPGVMMLAATIVFWMGAKKYVHVPPAPPNPDSFTRVARTALLARVDGGSRPGLYVAYVGVIGALYAFYSIPEWGFVISACTALVLLLAFGSMILPYALLTFGEVLVSATGLEFAYSQAPVSMKGAIMSFWNLSTTVGNLWVLIVNRSVMNEGVIGKIAESGISVTAFQMFFFAAFAAVAMLAFGLYAKRYKMVDNYRKTAVPA